MRASKGNSGTTPKMYQQNMQQIEPFYLSSSFEVLNSNNYSSENQIENMDEQFFTLESAPATDYFTYDSPHVSVSSNRTTFSPQSFTSGSPLSACSGVIDVSDYRQTLREIEDRLMAPVSEQDDTSICSHRSSVSQWNQIMEVAPQMDLKDVLLGCARAVSDNDIATAEILITVLEQRVSVFGEPIQRLCAYMVEGLRARLLSSGSAIYKKLKCTEPTSSELLSYMVILYQICPYYPFAYFSTNVIIHEVMENENRIHIIDFSIAQGSQWMFLMKALANRNGGPPFVRITGVDDSQSAHARGGGLELVGQKLAACAETCGVPFKFHAAGMSGCEVKLENLNIQNGEALAVNFPYMLHHMPDESVTTENHRDRLLRLVKKLSPKVVTLVEQESNTNSTSFLPRFYETLDYYTAMFESIDAGRPNRDDKQRMNAEENCVARDIVNIIACEGPERVERHEVFGKWKSRFMMAGFDQYPLSSSVMETTKGVLKAYSSNFSLEEKDNALFLAWKGRALATSSAWR